MKSGTTPFRVLAAAAAMTLGTFAYGQVTPSDTANQNAPGRTPQPSGQNIPRERTTPGDRPANDTGVMDSTPAGTGNRAGTSPQGQNTPRDMAQPGTSSDDMTDGAIPGDTTTGGRTGLAADQQASQQMMRIAKSGDKAPDQLFALMAANGNLFEVEFARLVNEKSQDQQIKQLAQHIMQEHQQANQRLQPAAQDLGLTLPTSLPSHKQQVLQVYRAMPVDKLETCFILENKALHAKDVTSYNDHTKTVQNEKLRAYVTETLPKLQQHTQMIVKAAQAKGISGDIAMQSGNTTGSPMRDANTSTDNK